MDGRVAREGERPVITKQTILLNQYALTGDLDLTPWLYTAWCDDITYVIDVQVQNGSPGSGILTANLQYGVTHKTGDYQYANQRLVTYDTAMNAKIEGGTGFGTIYTVGSTALPATYSRTIVRPGARCNLQLKWTTPLASGSLQLSVVMLQRGS